MKQITAICFSLLYLLADCQPQTQFVCKDSVEVYGLQSVVPGIKLYSRLRLVNGDVLLYNIVTNTYFNNADFADYIVRLDSNGNFKQGVKIKIFNNLGSSQRFHFAAASFDGGFALGGERYRIANDYSSFFHITCLRFDDNMNLLWKKEIVPKPNPNYDTTSPFHVKTMGFSPSNDVLFAVNFNPVELGSYPIVQDAPGPLAGPGHNFFFALTYREICDGVNV